MAENLPHLVIIDMPWKGGALRAAEKGRNTVILSAAKDRGGS